MQISPKHVCDGVCYRYGCTLPDGAPVVKINKAVVEAMRRDRGRLSRSLLD